VALALDADRAGQQAIVRAARVAAGHQLALCVVVLPRGADLVDLVHSEGAKALQQRVDASVPACASASSASSTPTNRRPRRTRTASSPRRTRSLR
jgi:DNA primase